MRETVLRPRAFSESQYGRLKVRPHFIVPMSVFVILAETIDKYVLYDNLA